MTMVGTQRMITKKFESNRSFFESKDDFAGNMIILPQQIDTSLKIVNSDSFSCRYIFTRAAETRLAGECSQDYLALRYDRQKYVFVLCDGVGQSFYGELAASILGNHLLQWLWELPNEPIDSRDFFKILINKVNGLCDEATREILNHPLPKDIPLLFRDVLEQKRRSGSETTFVCGRLDLPRMKFPEGFLRLAWMGDTRLRLWESSKRCLCDFGKFRTEQRWSTLKGLVFGEPQVYCAPFLKNNVPRFSLIEAYTDGLDVLDRFKRPATNRQIRVMVNKLYSSPTSDDISYLGIRPNINGVRKFF